jgi:hypothetical protein
MDVLRYKKKEKTADVSDVPGANKSMHHTMC